MELSPPSLRHGGHNHGVIHHDNPLRFVSKSPILAYLSPDSRIPRLWPFPQATFGSAADGRAQFSGPTVLSHLHHFVPDPLPTKTAIALTRDSLARSIAPLCRRFPDLAVGCGALHGNRTRNPRYSILHRRRA